MAQTENTLTEQVIAWSSMDRTPPLSEIEALRMASALTEEEETLKQGLYRIIAFYRIMRVHKQDPISKQLLAASERTHPIVQEIDQFAQVNSYYLTIMDTDLPQWSIRETDFDPAKLKKSQSLHDQLTEAMQMYPRRLSGTNKLAAAYNRSYEELEDLLVLLEQTIETIEKRKTGSPVSAMNATVQQITKSLTAVKDALPNVLTQASENRPLEVLDQLIGLQEVKDYIHDYYHYLRYQQERKQFGFQMVDEPGLHMVITGNPGTGKTTIARLLAKLYHQLGLLESDHLVEVNRSHLVGSYLGQSEENTTNYVQQALGGVLFIDEAYSLKREGQSGNDYGQAVIDTLVSSMTSNEYGGRFAVILAGYPEETRQFLFANPGLRSRIPDQNYLELPDFKTEELLQIAENTALANDFFFTEEALRLVEDTIEQSKVDDTFGNARTVRDIVLRIIFQKGADRTLTADSWIDHMKLSSSDVNNPRKAEDTSEPLEQLEQLIGLQTIKNEVKKLSSFVHIQQERKSKGAPAVPIQLHAVFTGNPGTGKTTIAKIYAGILKERGLLKRGHLVVASRSDLVAGYVGQTAAKTKAVIRDALGGVLFIDEAYSLFRGAQDFGKEAIDTLVDEMTKHNENLVVVLAGYQQEMKRFIDSNPGLASRFKKYFVFPDYDSEELVAIFKRAMENYAYTLEEEAEAYLNEQLSTETVSGNGRFVTNLLDEAIQFQSLRLLEEEQTNMDMLTKSDIENAWNMVRRSAL
ncbi:AAA+-type ATPase, SpoVK/Ycf46/Vps4 family [Terribacillus aidingensis]|uniref:AAA+-type ATPase, SpoVK/Ycf46/Vps4 family n=2 Tax=Terribacillus aidingensis TaxID=586416 RepID=A0A285NKQ0_9BACI|nr:AAA+-type ATPase, SpoVK/Ycf46/Vps4 family [Terribacillus aidingensis]